MVRHIRNASEFNPDLTLKLDTALVIHTDSTRTNPRIPISASTEIYEQST